MNKYILGSANFGNLYKGTLLGAADVYEILDKAWELGIRDIDTARTYGDSEMLIGEYIRATKRNFRVWTKGRSEKDYEMSKQVLGLTPHSFLWHNWDATDDITGFQVDGISCYDAMEWLKVERCIGLDIIQLPWNIIDRGNEWNAKLAQEYSVTTVARSVFIRGEAFKMPDITGVPFWQWCLQIPDCFDYVVVGVDSADQLEQIVNCPRLKLIYKEGGLSCQRL
jgi:aryl-alcohol dehydrogenase-like predicted oxidoreductase